MIVPMETLSPPLEGAALASRRGGGDPLKVARIARVKFVALPPHPAREADPAPKDDDGAGRPAAGKILRDLLRRIGIRVIGRPTAARP